MYENEHTDPTGGLKRAYIQLLPGGAMNQQINGGSLNHVNYLVPLRVPGGVQHGVWTRLPSFMIIRESIDITMLKPYIF